MIVSRFARRDSRGVITPATGSWLLPNFNDGNFMSTHRKTHVARLLFAAAGLLVSAQTCLAGTWTKIVNNPPAGINLMLLLSDGTVMCANNNGSTIGKAWYKLTPNASGSYVNGTWSTLASAINTRLYYPAQVMTDGRVFVAGGEYGTGGPFAEVYNPLTNAWTNVTPPAAVWNTGSDNFYDCNSEMLPDGRVLSMPVFPHASAIPLIYNPSANTWANAGKLFRGTYQDEASWVKLPDNSILTIDPFGTLSERYIPAQNKWVNDGTVPVSLYDAFGFELGGALMLPNGKAFFLGSTGHTATYTPTGTTSPGTWAASADIPSAKGTPDAPAAMMIDGKILCAVSPVPTSANHFPSPTTFYEYDYLTNSFTSVNAPVGASDNISSYQAAMLQLPNGQVMYSHMNTSVYVYTPSGAPLAAGKPTITSISANLDGSFHMVGTKLNGISTGATYGDDLQMNTNYPIVRISHSNGNTYYARTFNWSSTGVQTGAASVTTEYTLPAGFPAGAYTLVVTANGIASDPASTPSVTAPGDFTACKSATATLSVTASGTGPFTYQWRKGVTNLTNGGNISGATSPTLSIFPVTGADTAANYNCVVTNALGSATSANGSVTFCPADFDCSGFVDVEDYNAYVQAFEAGTDDADFDGTGFVDVDDFNSFVVAFENGC